MQSNNKKPKIWAVGGGKGGIGKSFVISNLAITLAKQGKKVIVADLDFGGANLHTCLGTTIPKKTLSDLVSGKALSAKELLCETNIKNLGLISGANDVLDIANLTADQNNLILNHLKTLECDYLLLDLGAGTLQNTLSCFITADKPIVALTPEPTSIENAYRFIKSSYFTWLKAAEKNLELKEVINSAMGLQNKFGIKTPADLIEKICELNPEQGAILKEQAKSFKIHIILNQVRSMSDLDVGEAVKSICKKYFGVESVYVGHLEYDNSVWQSVRQHKPVVLEHPYSKLVMTFNHLVKTLREDEEQHKAAKLLRVA